MMQNCVLLDDFVLRCHCQLFWSLQKRWCRRQHVVFVPICHPSPVMECHVSGRVPPKLTECGTSVEISKWDMCVPFSSYVTVWAHQKFHDSIHFQRWSQLFECNLKLEKWKQVQCAAAFHWDHTMVQPQWSLMWPQMQIKEAMKTNKRWLICKEVNAIVSWHWWHNVPMSLRCIRKDMNCTFVCSQNLQALKKKQKQLSVAPSHKGTTS